MCITEASEYQKTFFVPRSKNGVPSPMWGGSVFDLVIIFQKTQANTDSTSPQVTRIYIRTALPREKSTHLLLLYILLQRGRSLICSDSKSHGLTHPETTDLDRMSTAVCLQQNTCPTQRRAAGCIHTTNDLVACIPLQDRALVAIVVDNNPQRLHTIAQGRATKHRCLVFILYFLATMDAQTIFAPATSFA